MINEPIDLTHRLNSLAGQVLFRLLNDLLNHVLLAITSSNEYNQLRVVDDRISQCDTLWRGLG